MLRSGFIFSLTICFLLTFFTKTAFALDYNQSRLDYQTQYSKYRETLVEYRSARSEYLTYKTLVSQTRAIYVTQQFLIARENVVINYLKMIEARIESAGPFLSTEIYSPIKLQIDDQFEFHLEQQPKIEAAATLKDLEKVSAKIDSNINIVNIIGLQTQALILDSRMQEYQSTTVNLYAFASEQVKRIAKEGQKDTTDIDRWLLEADEKYRLANQGLIQTQLSINLIDSDKKYENYRTALKKSRQYLKETNTLLNEIIINLKIK